LDGKNPYNSDRFVTPPLSAYLGMPFARFHPNDAITYFFWLNSLAIAGGLAFIYKCFDLTEKRSVTLLSLALSALFSYPVFLLLHRGNIDAVVFFFLAAGIYASSRTPTWGSDILAGIAFAVAIHLKLYPLIVFLPIIAVRRWRLAGSLSFFLILFASFAFWLWPDFLERILQRKETFALGANGSLESTLNFVVLFLDRYVIKISTTGGMGAALTKTAYGLYSVLLASLWIIDLAHGNSQQKGNFAETIIMYIPFMVIVPGIAHHYEFILALSFIPLISWLQEINPGSYRYILLLAGGVILTQFQASALFQLTENILMYVLPGAGMLILIIVCIFLKLHFRSEDVKAG
jgi:hypothetical protein